MTITQKSFELALPVARRCDVTLSPPASQNVIRPMLNPALARFSFKHFMTLECKLPSALVIKVLVNCMSALSGSESRINDANIPYPTGQPSQSVR